MNLPPEVVLALLTGAAVVLAYPVASAIAWAQHRLARDRSRKTAAVLAEKAGLAAASADEKRCNRCALPLEQALTLPCACETDCGANHCLAFFAAIGGSR